MTTAPVLVHLARMTSPLGLYEHALGTEPRTEHAYCVDDVARALVLTSRIVQPTTESRRLSRIYLSFLLAAQHADGLTHNRRNLDGTWSDDVSADDHWGRSLWALGTAAAHLDEPVLAAQAREGARLATRARSRWPRSRAYAALGAAELLRIDPADRDSLGLLQDVRSAFGRGSSDARAWPWPEPRLTYANAVLPQAMIVVGDLLHDDRLRAEGLTLLGWLVQQQDATTHLSFVPSTGRQRGLSGPAYPQQPIEAAALAEACRTAFDSTGDPIWSTTLDRCTDWFEGANDGRAQMRDAVTGGCSDGLEADHASTNQGAESTLAWLTTEQLRSMPVREPVR